MTQSLKIKPEGGSYNTTGAYLELVEYILKYALYHT